MNDVKVNDGGGLFDSIGLIDSLLVDCNDLTKMLVDGRFVGYCSVIVSMVQKLSELKTGVKNDMDSLKKQVEELTKEARNNV